PRPTKSCRAPSAAASSCVRTSPACEPHPRAAMTTARATEQRVALIATAADAVVAIELDDLGREIGRVPLSHAEFADWVREREARDGPRWVIRAARELYPALLSAGVTLTRTHDLVLCHAILRDTASVTPALPASAAWLSQDPVPSEPSLFDVFDRPEGDPVAGHLEQYRAQRRIIDADAEGRLGLLCAAESAGALIAEQMRAAGMPWVVAEHDRILVETLGERSPSGGLPSRMA